MKYAIKPIKIAPEVWLGVDQEGEIAPGLWLGVDQEGEWELRRPYAIRDRRPLCEKMDYILNFAALVLKSAEAVEVAVLGRLWTEALGIGQFDDRAVQKLIDRANKLWTFEVEK